MTDNTKILVPYEEFAQKAKDSADLNSIKSILNTEFPDDTCQVLAIKAILGMIEEEEPVIPDEPIVEPEPEDPDDSTTTPDGE